MESFLLLATTWVAWVEHAFNRLLKTRIASASCQGTTSVVPISSLFLVRANSCSAELQFGCSVDLQVHARATRQFI